jgi:hypothetical protein
VSARSSAWLWVDAQLGSGSAQLGLAEFLGLSVGVGLSMELGAGLGEGACDGLAMGLAVGLGVGLGIGFGAKQTARILADRTIGPAAAFRRGNDGVAFTRRAHEVQSVIGNVAWMTWPLRVHTAWKLFRGSRWMIPLSNCVPSPGHRTPGDWLSARSSTGNRTTPRATLVGLFRDQHAGEPGEIRTLNLVIKSHLLYR